MKVLKLMLSILSFLIARPAFSQPLPELIPYKAATGWGYSDSNKVIKVPCIYRSASLFYNGKGRVTMERDGEVVHCVVDREGKYIIGPEVHWNGQRNQYSKFGMLNAHDSTGRWGIIDTTRKAIVPFLYDAPESEETLPSFQRYGLKTGDFLLLKKEGKSGIIDTNYKVIVDFEYDEIAPAWNNSLTDSICGWLLKSGEFWGYADLRGHLVLPCRYDTIIATYPGEFRKGIALLRNTTWQWYDFRDARVVPRVFESMPYQVGPFLAASGPIPRDKSQRLFSSKGKLVYNKAGAVFSEYNDTVWAQKLEPYPSTTRMDTTDFGWLDRRKMEVQWDKISSPVARRYFQYLPPDVSGTSLFIERERERVLAFGKDGKIWEVSNAVGPRVTGIRSPDNQYVAVALRFADTDQQLSAVVDSNLDFIVAPQSSLEIIGGDIPSKYLIVLDRNRQGQGCGVTDLNLNWIVRPQKRLIGACFQQGGKRYLIGSVNEGLPNFSYRADHWKGTDTLYWPYRWNVPMTLLDEWGGIVRGFEKSTAPVFFADGARTLQTPVTDVLMVTEAGKTVFRKLDGSVVFPKISGRHDRIIMVGSNVFFAIDSGNNRVQCLDSSGRKVLPVLKDIVVDVISETPQSVFTWSETVPENLDAGTPGLAVVIYAKDKYAETEGHGFYIDRHGTIYADPDAIVQ